MNDINEFKQHIPPFVDGVEKKSFNFYTIDELLENPIVNRWKMHPFDEEKPHEYFYRYSISGKYLMAEFYEGKEWYVIGSILHPEKLDLPTWEPNRKDK